MNKWTLVNQWTCWTAFRASFINPIYKDWKFNWPIAKIFIRKRLREDIGLRFGNLFLKNARNLDSRSEKKVRLVPRFFLFFSIGATILTCRKIQCFPYARFFVLQFFFITKLLCHQFFIITNICSLKFSNFFLLV